MYAQMQLTPNDQPTLLDKVVAFHSPNDDTWFAVRFYGMSLIFATSEQFQAFRTMLNDVDSYQHEYPK